MTTMQTIIIEDKKLWGVVVVLTPHSPPFNKWKERKPHTHQEKNEGSVSVEFSLITFGHILNQIENT
jgi:hypothetical protein